MAVETSSDAQTFSWLVAPADTKGDASLSLIPAA
jgi:hypothetical protein